MSDVSVVTIQYSNYVVDEDFLPQLITAVAQGKIKSAEKKYLDNQTKVVVGRPINIESERCQVVTSKEAELEELKKKIKALEESNG